MPQEKKQCKEIARCNVWCIPSQTLLQYLKKNGINCVLQADSWLLKAAYSGYPLSRLCKKGGLSFSSRTTVKPVDIDGH